MQVNNIYISGRFQHRKQEELFSWTNKHLLLYDNKIILKKNSFCLTLTKNIRQVLELHNLHKILRKRFRKEIGAKIRNMKWKIGNIHESLTIQCSPKEITSKLLPRIENEIGVDKIYITQEQNTPVCVDLEQVKKREHLEFISLKINIRDKSASVKIQLSKNRKSAQITVIITKFTEETNNLIHFLESYISSK